MSEIKGMPLLKRLIDAYGVSGNEEEIRNFFLIQLNGHYQGNATGETFNGVGKTDIRTFVAKSERGFNVAWPFALSRNVARQDVEASTNLFENSNFIKSYGSPEKFQKFY